MKFIISISLNILLLLVFTTAPTTSTWACGGDKCKKETTEHKSKCQKDCCKKPSSDSKKNKKGCCGDNCNCSVSITVMADMPTQLPLSISTNFCPIFIEKRPFFYKRAIIQSTIQDIWQPPITFLIA
jgi:hypothetical protein